MDKLYLILIIIFIGKILERFFVTGLENTFQHSVQAQVQRPFTLSFSPSAPLRSPGLTSYIDVICYIVLSRIQTFLFMLFDNSKQVLLLNILIT